MLIEKFVEKFRKRVIIVFKLLSIIYFVLVRSTCTGQYKSSFRIADVMIFNNKIHMLEIKINVETNSRVRKTFFYVKKKFRNLS